MASNCPPRTVHPSQKLNQDNIGELVVASHRNFVEAAGESAEAVSLGDQFSWDDDMDSAPEVDTTEIMD